MAPSAKRRTVLGYLNAAVFQLGRAGSAALKCAEVSDTELVRLAATTRMVQQIANDLRVWKPRLVRTVKPRR